MGQTISYASYKAKQSRIQEQDITDRLKIIEHDIAITLRQENKQELITLTKELEGINNERSKGVQIRARAMNIELNEKNTAYFLNKEKANHQVKNIKSLIQNRL